MKKRGFGEGFWNGYGGKFDPQEDKDIVNSAIRECREESNVEIIDPKKVGEIDFEFKTKPEWNQRAHIFLVESWKGEPEETEEMRPKWFKVSGIPYDKMWVDDVIWLPRVLDDESLRARFVFLDDKEIVEQDIRTASFK
jgi:hypothetical protein